MDIKVESELYIERDIKTEGELIIESDWLPIEYENDEYYQDFVQECNQNTFNETVVTDEDDDCTGSNGTCTENDSDEEGSSLGYLEAQEDEYNTSGSYSNMYCPLCPYNCIKHIHLCYHFVDKHPHEYKAKLIYNCHLCKHLIFSEEELFFQHLIEKHDLSSWKVLNYRKVFEDKEYLACKKCHRLLFQNDVCKLLSHFLMHDKNFHWSCKFCYKKVYFKMSPVSHMCDNMMRYYKKHSNEIHEASKKTDVRIKNLQEFEEHIAQVCPFCNKEFSKILKWKNHLSTDHEIDTLKGLEMKVIANDSNKLRCVICHTIVENSPEKLHAHRFQHLPFKPYKCLYCSKTFNTFKMAVNHDIKRCKNEDVPLEKIDDPGYEMRLFLEMQCSFCDFKKFYDSKNVSKHYEDEHNYFQNFFIKQSDDSVACEICHKKYALYEKKSCFLHLHQHFDEKTFKCKLCLRSYSTLEYFSMHFSHYHNINKPLSKQSHEKTTYNKEDEVSNVRELPHLGESSFKSQALNEFVEFISYACPECNEGMATQQIWHNHILTQHTCFNESNLYIRKADGSLKCPTCNKSANTRRLIQQNHKLTHLQYKSFICNLCYVRFNALGGLYKHLRRKHFTQGTFKCPICPEVLQTEHQRTVHLKEIHPRNEWPDTICLICYQILSTKDQLEAHILTHDAEENFDSRKIIGEFKEQMSDDITSQSASKINQSNDNNDIEIAPKYEAKHKNKRKSLTKYSATKKKKVHAE